MAGETQVTQREKRDRKVSSICAGWVHCSNEARGHLNFLSELCLWVF